MNSTHIIYESFDDTKILHMVTGFKEMPTVIDNLLGEAIIMLNLSSIKGDNLPDSKNDAYKNLLTEIKEDRIKEVKNLTRNNYEYIRHRIH